MENDTKGAYIKDGMTGSYYYVQVTWMSRMKYFMGVLPLVFFVSIHTTQIYLTLTLQMVINYSLLLSTDNDHISIYTAVAVPNIQTYM